jgi:hypothetical protein
MKSSQQSIATVPVQNSYQIYANTLFALSLLIGLTFPGALCGALLAAVFWKTTREPILLKVIFAVLGLLSAAVSQSIVFGWLWRLALTAITSGPLPAPAAQLARSVAVEALLGPTLLLLLELAYTCRLRTALGAMTREHNRMTRRAKALRIGYGPPLGPPGHSSNPGDWDHPPGKIRLGIDEAGRVFDVDLEEVAQHIFIPGATGTGKTNTFMRLATGAVSNGYGLAIIDCKGIGLAKRAHALAESFDLPFNVVDPDDPSSIGYDPCTGEAAHIANKLIGAFSFTGEAEIYKNVAMEVVPVIARSLVATGQPVTLWRIYDSLAKGGLARLGRTPGAERFRERLDSLEKSGGIVREGYIGLQSRLGALMEGKFGALFAQTPSLDWDDVTKAPSVTYFSLSATGAGEDVDLFCRVITQDLKHLCDTRLRALQEGATLIPLLVVFDEFAALRESPQVVDLLLQARQAQVAVVLATQYLPQEVPIRTPALQAGLLICHRVVSADAKVVAEELSTHPYPELTAQIDFNTGVSDMGTTTLGEVFNVHPNVLRELPNGMTAIYARLSNRREVVRIHLDAA